MHSALPSGHSCLRLWPERCVYVLLAVIAMRTWYVEGLFTSVRVAGGSMAETLVGVHREMVCADCEHRFACGTDRRPVGPRAICPMCGHVNDGLDRQKDRRADRVLVHKSIYRFREPRRWEVVAFRDPGQADRICVKRVVGLPHESIQIRHGDVYADERIQRKNLSKQRGLAVLVHDASRRPTLDPALPPRWQAEDNELGKNPWPGHGGRYVHFLPQDKEPTDDWLEYRHWRRTPGKEGRIEEGPVTDVCGYNQTRPRRAEDTHAVTDLMLSLQVLETPKLTEGSDRGQLAIRATDGRDEFQVRINPKRSRYEVLRNGRPVPWAGGKSPPLVDGMTVTVSLFDQQFLLAFDGRKVVRQPYDPSQQTSQPTSRPFAVGSLGGLWVVITNLRVYRDVYYTHPIGPQGRWGLDDPFRLGEEEYFVLGDNSPISDDSRTWPEGPAVAANLLVGKPFLVHFPAKRVQLGRWEFQVPDPTKIRYIR